MGGLFPPPLIPSPSQGLPKSPGGSVLCPSPLSPGRVSRNSKQRDADTPEPRTWPFSAPSHPPGDVETPLSHQPDGTLGQAGDLGWGRGDRVSKRNSFVRGRVAPRGEYPRAILGGENAFPDTVSSERVTVKTCGPLLCFSPPTHTPHGPSVKKKKRVGHSSMPQEGTRGWWAVHAQRLQPN